MSGDAEAVLRLFPFIDNLQDISSVYTRLQDLVVRPAEVNPVWLLRVPFKA